MGEKYIYSSRRKNKSRGSNAERQMNNVPSLFVQLPPRSSHKPSYSTRSPRVARYADSSDDNAPAEIVYQDLSQLAAVANSSVAMEHSMVMFNKSTQKLKELVSDLDKHHDENLRKLENSLNQCIISVAVSQATDKVDIENKINEIRTAMVYAENFQKNILLTKAIDLDERMADIEEILSEYKSVMTLSGGDHSSTLEFARRFDEIDGILDNVLEREGELQQQLLNQERQTAQLVMERDELRSLVNLYGSEIENLKQRLSSAENTVQDMVDQARRDLKEAQRVAQEQALKQEAFQNAMSTLGQRFVYQPGAAPMSSPDPKNGPSESSVENTRGGLTQSSVQSVTANHQDPSPPVARGSGNTSSAVTPATSVVINDHPSVNTSTLDGRAQPSADLTTNLSRSRVEESSVAAPNKRENSKTSGPRFKEQSSVSQNSAEDSSKSPAAQVDGSSKRVSESKQQQQAELKSDATAAGSPRTSGDAGPVQPTTPRSKQGQRPNSRSQTAQAPKTPQQVSRPPVPGDQDGSVWVDDASEVLENAGRGVKMNSALSSSVERSSQHPEQLASASALQSKIEEHEALVQRLDNVRTKIKNEVAAWISKFQEVNKRKPTDADKGDVLPLYKAYHEVRTLVIFVFNCIV
jgi:ribosomal protein L17/Mor family transcriptional regulator